MQIFLLLTDSLFFHNKLQRWKKIDISLIYETKKGEITDKQKSVSGYGVFKNPKPNEFNQIAKRINSGLVFSERGTKKLINSILKNKNLGKIFIEPHLKKTD